MPEPYSNEAPMRRILPLVILLLVLVALVLAAVSALTSFWNVGDTPDWQQQKQLRGVAPALETAPQPALHAYQAQKTKTADSYAWVSKKQNLIRIPIEVAMQALAQPDQRTAGEREAYLLSVQGGQDKQSGKDAAMRALQAADAVASHAKSEEGNISTKPSPAPGPSLQGREQSSESKP